MGTSNSYVCDSHDNPQTSTRRLCHRPYAAGTDSAREICRTRRVSLVGDVLYILDSGNSRILRLSSDFSLLAEIRLKDEAQRAASFPQCGRAFVRTTRFGLRCGRRKQGGLYRGWGRNGAPHHRFRSDVLPDEFDYRPNKVIVDGAGVIFTSCPGELRAARSSLTAV